MHQRIDAFVSIAENIEYADVESCESTIYQALKNYLLQELKAFGCQLAESEVLALMDMDLNLNAQGLCCWLEYKKSKNSRAG